MNMSLLIPEGDNLVTYYVLPLIGVNKKSFASAYKTAYLNAVGSNIFVELSKNLITPVYKKNGFYISELLLDNKLFVMFSVPAEFYEDVQLFIKGNYSKMSSEAKKIIYTTSTLQYNKTIGSFSMSHPVLQALDKTKTLRTFLSDYLGIQPLPDSVELINPPDESWFIEYKFKTLEAPKHV